MEAALEPSKKTPILFSPEAHQRLTRLAERRRTSLGEPVREACVAQSGLVDTDAHVRRPLSARRRSDHDDLCGAPAARAPSRPGLSPLAPGRLVGAPAPAAASRGDEPPAAPASDGDSSFRAYDSVCDTCTDGRPPTSLTVIDEFTRECWAIDVAGGVRAGRAIEVLTRRVSLHGAPRSLRSDHGPACVAQAVLRWSLAA